MPKTWRAWTTGEYHRLRALRADGRTCAEIAALLGRSPGAVKKRAPRLQPKTLRRLTDWLAVLTHAHTLAGAARVMGTSIWAVKRTKSRLRRMGHAVAPAVPIRTQRSVPAAPRYDAGRDVTCKACGDPLDPGGRSVCAACAARGY